MRERAARIGGKLTVASATKSGTVITVVVPGPIIFRNTSVTPICKNQGHLKQIGRTSDSDRLTGTVPAAAAESPIRTRQKTANGTGRRPQDGPTLIVERSSEVPCRPFSRRVILLRLPEGFPGNKDPAT